MLAELQRLGRAAPEPEPLPPEELTPELKTYLERTVGKVQAAAMAETRALRDQLDATQFQGVAASSGADPAQVQQAEALYRSWVNTGTMVTQYDQQGRPVQMPPSRIDAMRFVLGASMIDQGIKAAPTRQKTQLQALLGGGRPAGAGFEPAAPQSALPANYSTLEPAKRVAAFEAAMDGKEF